MKEKNEKITQLPSEFGGDVPMTTKQIKFWKKIYYAVFFGWVAMMLMVAFSGCSPSDKEQVDLLTQQKQNLTSEVSQLSSQAFSLDTMIERKRTDANWLDEKLKILKFYESGKTPKYILKLHLKQTHFSLSISKHIKDAMNAIDFDMPVDKDFYDQVSVGTNIVDNFRVGSCILYGSFGDWNMTVKGKEIR